MVGRSLSPGLSRALARLRYTPLSGMLGYLRLWQRLSHPRNAPIIGFNFAKDSAACLAQQAKQKFAIAQPARTKISNSHSSARHRK